MMPIVMSSQRDNYRYFIETGKGIIEASTRSSMGSDYRMANAELAKACAMLAEACKNEHHEGAVQDD